MLQDITQTYTQSKTEFNFIVICYLPVKLKKRYPESTVLRVIKILYGLAEAANHQFATYLDHYKEKLGMKMSSYDAFLFITKAASENFGIAGLQTDNTFNIGIEVFMNKKEAEIIKANVIDSTQ